MPTAKWSLSVLSLQSALVVVGGLTSSSYTAGVEIFRPDTSLWYRTDPLPTACCNISVFVTNSTVSCYMYALGGYNGLLLNQALYASVDDLLVNAVPANQTIHSDTQSAWKTLPNTPTRFPAPAVLAGSLFALGGRMTPERRADKKEIYMYSPSINSWVHFSNLPTLRATIGLAALSPTEILVIGGWNSDGVRVNTVYKGTYMLC